LALLKEIDDVIKIALKVDELDCSIL